MRDISLEFWARSVPVIGKTRGFLNREACRLCAMWLFAKQPPLHWVAI